MKPRKQIIKKIEFWTASLIYFALFLGLISKTISQYLRNDWLKFYENNISFSSFTNFFAPEFIKITVLYLAFLVLNFRVFPSLLAKKKITLNIFFVLAIIVAVATILGVCRTYSHTYELVEYKTVQQAYNHIFFKSFYKTILLVIPVAGFFLFKELIIGLILNNPTQHRENNQFKFDIGIGITIWALISAPWIASNSHMHLIIMVLLTTLFTLASIIYALHYLLPTISHKGELFKHFLKEMLIIACILAIPVSLFATILIEPKLQMVGIALLFHLPLQLFVSIPLTWFIYKKRHAKNAEIKELKTELGKSDANLNFLKSQINPHFLFNALNTLYGTSLQENADRTSEGIQKLGDMMRFMLHENVKDKILLMRDVEYLNNYISLQKLRIVESAEIKIDVQIEEYLNDLEISPMLLIPFVENAFKHGISLQQPSYIKITLHTKDDMLFFDVSNSIHIKNNNDPEKLKSGIGLENVKQRLMLLYPDKHELTIHQSANDFYTHLILELK